MSESDPNQRTQSKIFSGERHISCFLFFTIFKKTGFHVHKITEKTYLITKSVSGENKTIWKISNCLTPQAIPIWDCVLLFSLL